MEIKEKVKDIRFWIVVFFVIRLIGITNAPIEAGHNWRQTTVTMVARNYYEVDNNIFYPRVDFAGEKTGITGMEFPFLNYLIYLVSTIFGYQHWYGRLINLLVTSLGLWYFFRLIKQYYQERTAFYSTIILTCSIWFQFSRKIMPDTFAMSLIIVALYYGSNYLEGRNLKYQLHYLIAYFLLLVFGVLSKLPSGYILVIFIVFIINRGIPIKRKIIFMGVSGLGMLPVFYWYFTWVPHLVEEYGFWHFFMGKGISQGFNEIVENFNQTLNRFYDTALKYVGFAAFSYGLVVAAIKLNRNVLMVFLLGLLSFIVIIIKAGETFPHHNYYIIPFVPVMALVAGYGLSEVKKTNLALLILIVISVEGVANQQHDLWHIEKNKHLLELESDLDKVSSPADLIIINSGQYPTPMYFAHRKGWVDFNDRIKDPEFIKSLKNKGLKYIVILKRAGDIPLNQYRKVFDNHDYTIYAI